MKKDLRNELYKKYRAGRLPLSADLSILRAWIVRVEQYYLSVQSLLEPYPEQLAELESVFAEVGGKDYWKK